MGAGLGAKIPMREPAVCPFRSTSRSIAFSLTHNATSLSLNALASIKVSKDRSKRFRVSDPSPGQVDIAEISKNDLSGGSIIPTARKPIACWRKSDDTYATRILSCSYLAPRQVGSVTAGNCLSVHSSAYFSRSRDELEMPRNRNGVVPFNLVVSEAVSRSHSTFRFFQLQRFILGYRRAASASVSSGLRIRALSKSSSASSNRLRSLNALPRPSQGSAKSGSVSKALP